MDFWQAKIYWMGKAGVGSGTSYQTRGSHRWHRWNLYKGQRSNSKENVHRQETMVAPAPSRELTTN